ncbi:probable serine/threonine-protein kinase dyrk1 [Drosophila gunungcola]|uniref:MADF domain-containing protein n=1 Tax=Drosophila gunungcola TaxID=103775 RepID=A0A9P9YP93_9MUSC|nr:probable serine/threonine-protein kinase dyrk1 [Drosophila gunungcola]KAI8040109.1 hypothetical protein M5D96_007539 [Drosophila gunungcola]
MMDEQLIDEVAQHGVIYNRQKYYLNGGANGGKYETKDEAWQLIAMKLRTDVDTCKKRWKYLRERYVSQRKQGDPPVYEHLSRPYLEKMKFLDQHIQPRKSYRHVPNFLTSPQSANSSSYNEYQVDKSNGSMKNVSQFNSSGQSHHYHQPDQQHAMSALSTAAASALENVNGQVKIEADQVFRDFAAAVASQQLQHISQSQMQQQAAAVAAVMADSSQGYQDQYKDGTSVGVNGVQNSAGSLTSTSSSMKSPLSSPLQGIGAGTLHSQQQQQQSQQQQQQQQHPSQQQSPASGQQLPVVHSSSSAASGSISTSSNLQMQQSHVYNPKGDDLDSSASSNFHMKKPRVQLNGSAHTQMASNGSHFGNDSDDDSDDNSHDLMEPQVLMQHDNHYGNSMNMQRGNGNGNSNCTGSNSGSNITSGNNSGHNNQQQQQQQHQNMFPSNTDFLFQLYQQFPHQANSSHPSNFGKFQAPPNHPGVQRLSEHLLGELVTTELLKMNKERKKSAQKRILEILFFDD